MTALRRYGSLRSLIQRLVPPAPSRCLVHVCPLSGRSVCRQFRLHVAGSSLITPLDLVAVLLLGILAAVALQS
jgi:hypothetical protein